MQKVKCAVTQCYHNVKRMCGRDSVGIKGDGLGDTDCADYKGKDRDVK